MSEPYARCYDCSWEDRSTQPYTAAQQHLEDQPEHHAYATGWEAK